MTAQTNVLQYPGKNQYAVVIVTALGFTLWLFLAFYFVVEFIRIGFGHPIISKRYHGLTLTIVTGLIICSIGASGLFLYQSGFVNYIRAASGLLAILGISIAQYAGAFRYWMIYYNVNFSFVAKSHQWKRLIDPQYLQTDNTNNTNNTSKHDWFIKNRNKWGSFKYVQKWVISAYLTLTAIELSLYAI